MSSRDEDLDWLYGRDRSSAPAPAEATRPFPEPVRGANAGAPRYAPAPFLPPAVTASRPSGGPAYPSEAPPTGYVPRGFPSPPGPPQGSPPSGVGGAGPVPQAKGRHRVRATVLVLLVLILLAVGWLVAVPVHAWSQVHRIADAPSGHRPPDQPGTTFLLVGSDSRAGLSKAEEHKLGTGSTAGQRTDTIMIMYMPPSGRPALISVPRDSYVPIPGHGTNKINAAYSLGGPKLLVQTLEQDTGLRMDAYAEIGFAGFVSVIDSLGGIDMCIPNNISDADSHLKLTKGCQTLDGTTALGYVRMRKADPRGDLGRVERQRQMLAAVAKKSASAGSVLNPVRYWDLIHAGTNALTLGNDTSFWQTASLALAMKRVAGGDGLTLTVPVADANAYTSVGSAVLWDSAKARAMFADIAKGDTARLAQYAK